MVRDGTYVHRDSIAVVSERALNEKEKGNIFHKAGNYLEALLCYDAGIAAVCEIHNIEGFLEYEHTKLLASLHSNCSLAQAMRGNFVKAAFQSGAALTAMRPDMRSGYSLMESSQHGLMKPDLQPLYIKVRRRRAAAMENLLNYPVAMANLQCLGAPNTFKKPGRRTNNDPQVTEDIEHAALAVGRGMLSNQPQTPPAVPYCPKDGNLYVCGRVVTWKPYIEDSDLSSDVSADCRNVPVVGAVQNGRNGSCKVFLYQGITESCPFARLTVISISIDSEPVWRSVTQSGIHLPKGGDTQRAVLAFPSKSNLYLACIGGKGIATPPMDIRIGHRQCDVCEVMQTDKHIDFITYETASRQSGLNCRTNAASIFDEGLLYVFGGTSLTEDGKVRVHNDLWTLNVVGQFWKCLHPGSDEYTGDCPRKTSGAAMWAFKGHVYLWSGVVKGPDHMVEMFDTTEMWVWRGGSWHPVPANLEDTERMHYAPCPRHNAGCAVSEGGKVYIVGGRKYSDFCVIVPGQGTEYKECILSDIWEFDILRPQWRQVLPEFGNKMPWMSAKDNPVVGVMSCGDLVVVGGIGPISDVAQDLGLWRLKLLPAASAGHANIAECRSHVLDAGSLPSRPWVREYFSRVVEVDADRFTLNSEVLLPLRGRPAFPIVYSCHADVVDVPRAFLSPRDKVSRISRREITAASDHSWEVGLMVTKHDWMTLPAPAKAEILRTLGGRRLMWGVKSVGCTESNIGPPRREIAIHDSNFGEREGSPGSFPLRLAFDDPCEQLGGIWWGSTQHIIEILDETLTYNICAIEVFQLVKLFSTAKAAQAYHMAFFPAFTHGMQRVAKKGTPALDKRNSVYQTMDRGYWQRPTVMGWAEGRVWTYFEVRLHKDDTKPRSPGEVTKSLAVTQSTVTAAIYAMDKLATNRLKCTTEWCPVQCHVCSDQEKVRLASSDGVDITEALAKKVKVCAGCGLVRFCSASCQQRGWRDHKSVCQAGGVRKTSPDDMPCL